MTNKPEQPESRRDDEAAHDPAKWTQTPIQPAGEPGTPAVGHLDDEAALPDEVGTRVEPAVYEASQWKLMYRRFKKHRVAFWMAHLVIVIYVICLNCGFFSPYDPNAIHEDWINMPPQVLKFGSVEGSAIPWFYVNPYQRVQHPTTLRRVYTLDRETRIPVRFFDEGSTWSFFGLFKTNIHLLGVDESKGETLFLLGTGSLGQDVLSRILYGGRVSLLLGLTGVAITFVLGIVLGGISGYYGGVADMIIQRAAEIFQTVPKIPIWLAMAAAIPKTWSSLEVYFAMTIILACIGWTGLCRVVRGKLLSLREEDYARAAILAGATERRVIFVHLVPNFFSHIIAGLTLAVPGMILAETSLSFLGLGLRPPIVSWGVLLQEATVNTIVNQPWILLPALAVIVTVLSMNFMGDGLRDAADPYAD